MTRAAGAMSREAVRADVRRRFHGPGPTPSAAGATSLGLEIELLPVCAGRTSILPIAGRAPSSGSILRSASAEAGWREDRSRGGAPTFHLPDGSRFSFEPGGQLEYSSAVHHSAQALLEACDRALALVRRHADAQGAALLACGIEPGRELARAPLLLHAERYTRMDAYFARLGPFGARMMRQTAALQINIAGGADPIARWRLLGAAAPALLGLFANSPVYAGRETGHASFRAHVWRQADQHRTGLPALGDDPVAEYAAFALDAPLMLLPDETGRYELARTRLERGALDAATWAEHCTTLFPEVRPKGYFEVRSLDALDDESCAAALAIVGGLACHPPAATEAAGMLPVPDAGRLIACGAVGLRDPATARLAADLAELGLRGAAALGPAWLSPGRLERAREAVARRLREPCVPRPAALRTAGVPLGSGAPAGR